MTQMRQLTMRQWFQLHHCSDVRGMVWEAIQELERKGFREFTREDVIDMMLEQRHGRYIPMRHSLGKYMQGYPGLKYLGHKDKMAHGDLSRKVHIYRLED